MSDAFSPDVGQQIAADGTIAYDFTGHISAQGLDLISNHYPANQPSLIDTAGPASKVTWSKLAGGALIAQIVGWDDQAGNTELAQWAKSVDGRSAVVVERCTAAGAAVVLAAAIPSSGSAQQRTIIDDVGRSSFAQLPAPGQAVMVAGSVVTSVGAGTNHTVAVPWNTAAPAGAVDQVVNVSAKPLSFGYEITLLEVGGAYDNTVTYVNISSASAQNIELHAISVLFY